MFLIGNHLIKLQNLRHFSKIWSKNGHFLPLKYRNFPILNTGIRYWLQYRNSVSVLDALINCTPLIACWKELRCGVARVAIFKVQASALLFSNLRIQKGSICQFQLISQCPDVRMSICPNVITMQHSAPLISANVWKLILWRQMV